MQRHLPRWLWSIFNGTVRVHSLQSRMWFRLRTWRIDSLRTLLWRMSIRIDKRIKQMWDEHCTRVKIRNTTRKQSQQQQSISANPSACVRVKRLLDFLESLRRSEWCHRWFQDIFNESIELRGVPSEIAQEWSNVHDKGIAIWNEFNLLERRWLSNRLNVHYHGRNRAR